MDDFNCNTTIVRECLLQIMKKAENEIVRNSLVVESVHLIQKVAPRVFIFENVAAFMKTGCTAPDGTVKAIGDVGL